MRARVDSEANIELVKGRPPKPGEPPYIAFPNTEYDAPPKLQVRGGWLRRLWVGSRLWQLWSG